MTTLTMHSCQPLHFGHSLLCPNVLHYDAMLMIISLRPSPLKNVYSGSHANMLATGCTCAFFVSVVLVVPQPIGTCVLNQLTIIVFSSFPTLMCHFQARHLPLSRSQHVPISMCPQEILQRGYLEIGTQSHFV